MFAVTTTADGGPGSLRQAILDSNLAVGGTNTIDFAIPGTGVQTIAPASPLPAITNPLVIDGSTQPGYAGAPLIAIVGQGAANPDPLTLGSDVTVKGVAIGGAGFTGASTSMILTVESVPISQAQGNLVTYQIVVAAGEDLVATAQAVGATMSLSLLDAQGGVVVQSDALSAADPVATIDTYIAAGTYSLQVHELSGDGSFTLMALMEPSDAPFQMIPIGAPSPSLNGNFPSIVAGDFNGDGQLDLAVVNSVDGTVSILMGNGDGTFQPPVDYSVGSGPRAIVAGAFSGNGTLDLAVANFNAGDVSILMGNGDGTFQPAIDYPVGSGPDAIVAGNFSGNGTIDLAVANEGSNLANEGSNSVSILMGNGDGTFQPAVNYPVGSQPRSIVAGDFSGNGKLDLAVANVYSGYVSILMGTGDGTFYPAVDYAVGNEPFGIAAGDFSGNGKLDLVVANLGGGNISILMGNGDGTFQPAVNGPAVESPWSIVVGDYNGDGKLDLAIAGANGVSILMGDGDGTFQSAVSYGGGYSSFGIVAGDFTGTDRADLAFVTSSRVSILLNNGDGTFQGPTIDGSGAIPSDNPIAIATGDFNGDGNLDMAVVTGVVTILLGDGDGTFRSAGTYEVGANPGAIVAGDFNGDGRLDLAVLNYSSDTVSILLGNGDGTFQPAVDYPVHEYSVQLLAGDFNGDGKLDLAVPDELGFVPILLGNGDGTFQPAVDYTYEPRVGGFVAGDFDGDGKLDLAGANNGSVTVSILLGNGDGMFQPAVDYAVGNDPGQLVAGDFNGDGKLDLAVSDSDGIQILLGNGNGTFQPAITVAAGISGNLVTGDFSGDGKLDLAVMNTNPGTNTTGTVSILLGNGDGTFQPAVNYPVGYEPLSIVAADFTGDGHLDLAVADQADTVVNAVGLPTRSSSCWARAMAPSRRRDSSP